VRRRIGSAKCGDFVWPVAEYLEASRPVKEPGLTQTPIPWCKVVLPFPRSGSGKICAADESAHRHGGKRSWRYH